MDKERYNYEIRSLHQILTREPSMVAVVGNSANSGRPLGCYELWLSQTLHVFSFTLMMMTILAPDCSSSCLILTPPLPIMWPTTEFGTKAWTNRRPSLTASTPVCQLIGSERGLCLSPRRGGLLKRVDLKFKKSTSKVQSTLTLTYMRAKAGIATTTAYSTKCGTSGGCNDFPWSRSRQIPAARHPDRLSADPDDLPVAHALRHLAESLAVARGPVAALSGTLWLWKVAESKHNSSE